MRKNEANEQQPEQMIDKFGPDYVQIIIDEQSGVLHVNVEGMCLFRATDIGTLVLTRTAKSGDESNEFISKDDLECNP